MQSFFWIRKSIRARVVYCGPSSADLPRHRLQRYGLLEVRLLIPSSVISVIRSKTPILSSLAILSYLLHSRGSMHRHNPSANLRLEPPTHPAELLPLETNDALTRRLEGPQVATVPELEKFVQTIIRRGKRNGQACRRRTKIVGGESAQPINQTATPSLPSCPRVTK
jgi:hypothetical protein